METESMYIGYLAVHRLLVFAVGILSIFLGYRLLMQGLYNPESRRSESLDASVGKFKLSAKNLAPGTMFALFGAVVVTGITIYRPPEITIEMVDKQGTRTKEVLRGDASAEKSAASAAAAMLLLKGGDRESARLRADQVSQRQASEWNDLAWVLASSGGDRDLATALAQAAVAAQKDNPNYLHTLAVIQHSNGNSKEAIVTLSRAAKFDPSHKNLLQQWTSEKR